MSTIFESESDGFHANENEDSEYINTSRERVQSLRTMRTAVSLAVVVMMVLVSAAVMISSSTDEAAPEMADISAITDGYVRVGLVSSVVNWNPLIAEMEEDYMMSSLIYSSLFTYDEDWGGPVNDLATGYTQVVDPVDNSMITHINITHHSYFNSASDLTGKTHQLTAEDVAFTFNLIKSEAGCTYDWYLQEVTVLGTANATGTGSFQDQIQLWTPYPKATLIDDITSVPILPKYLWEGYSNPFAGMQPAQLVGSGPFVFEDWLKDGWYKFKTAPNYHGSLTHPGEDRTVDVNGLLYTIYSGGDPLCVAVNMGIEDVVAITGYTQAYLNILGNQASVNVYKAAVSEMGICDVAINAVPPSFIDHEGTTYGGGNPVLLDPFVRQAIMMTLNKEYICDVLLHGLAVRGSSVIQPGYWQADIDEMPFDPDAARQLLIDHGWSADSDGDGFLEATASAYAVQMGYVDIGTELSGIRCQAPDTDKTYEYVALSWKGEAAKAGIQLIPSAESEMVMINMAWYNCDYDIWVWHWGWDPEPIGGALTVWLTELIKKGGDNCQMPMGEWWYGWDNYTEAPTTWTGRGETIEFTPQGPYSSFDQNISIALKTLDKAERKVILDELQQDIYDSYCENPPYYDLGLYGFTDYRFTNWGDFEAHPGRAFTSTLCWLWFDLVPVGANQMPVFETPLSSFYEVEVGVPVTFTIGVSDLEGDPIGVNWSFGDGETYGQYIDGDTTVERFTSATHVYTETATDLTLTVGVNDNPQHMYDVTMTAQVDVISFSGTPPEILSIYYDPDSALVGEEVTWTASAMDHEQGPDGDGLLFHWDWDDGSYTNSLHQPVANDTPVADTQAHVWTEAGTYVVTVSVTDGTNNASVMMSYTVVMLQEGFVMAQVGEPQTLDPATDYEPRGGEVIQNVYETLLFYDESQPEVLVPVLATTVPSVENGLVSPDGMTYTFPLREGVMFHDGTEMTADDVAYSIQRVLRMHEPTGPSWMLEQVMTHYISFYVGNTIQDWINSEGVTEPWLLDALPSDTSTVIEEEHMTAVAEAVVYTDGDHAVVFRLTSPYPGFLHIMATTVASIVSMDYVEANGGIVNGDENYHMAQHACGTGPFMVQTWDIGAQVHLARFDDYWGNAPELENVYIVSVGDVYDRIQMLEDGYADSAYLTVDHEYLFESDDYRIVKGLPDYHTLFAGFNFEIDAATATTFGSDVPSDFFNDVHVRRAFASVVDYDLFIDAILSGNAIHPNGAIPKDMFGYAETVPEHIFDLANVEAELKLAINPATDNSWWDDGFSIALLYNAGNIQRQAMCELIQSGFENLSLNFEVNVIALDWPTYLSCLWMSPSPMPFFWLGWACDYADPDNFMTPLLDSSYGVYPYSTGYSNDDLDTLVRAAATEGDHDERFDIYYNASVMVHDDVPYIWMAQTNSFHVERSWVTGYYFHPMLHGLDYAALGKSSVPENTPPVASFTVSPDSGSTSTVFWFDASSSFDLEDPAYNLMVRWDWEDDGIWDTAWSTNKTAIHSYSASGTYSVTMAVIDTGMLVDETTRTVTVMAASPGRSISYQWHGMFDHESGPWMEDRFALYGDEWVVTDSYPYIYMQESAPPGNTDIYTFMRLDIDGQDLPELNMNSNPEFLPLFGDADGGTAEIDWYMNYVTREECEAKLPSVPWYTYYDGWFVGLNGTVSLDEQAAMAVLGITSGEFDVFDMWWAANQDDVEDLWSQWLRNEAGRDRLDIYTMYEWVLTFLYFDMNAVKMGDHILVSMDTISWGMEALMTRWLHEAFMPTEWYMEDLSFHAVIGPEMADVNIDAAVAYSVFAYESLLDGTPCWAWQAMLQDFIPSSLPHPNSMFDPYADLEQIERSPSSLWTGMMVPYDYTPGAWDLSENETLSFEWPEGEVLFFAHDEGNTAGLIDNTAEFWSEMTLKYSVPDAGDAPGLVTVDHENRTISFEGPFDMGTWSEYQANHEWLADEWDRLGVLPYGVPYIEFTPVISPNQPPNASFTIDQEATYVGGIVMVDASSSYDPEDPASALEVRWDWQNDGVWDTDWTTEKTALYQLLVAGEHIIALEVRDSCGLTDTATNTVQAFEESFVQGEFPDRTFVMVKSSDAKGPVRLDAKMKPLQDCEWWLDLTRMDGTKVIVNVYKSRAASSSLVSTSELTAEGDTSEHIMLEAGAVYRVTIEYYGKAGIAELEERGIPSTPTLYHEPIMIVGDYDFTPENGVVGGSGTVADPYVIAGWIIEPTEGNGISVLGTTKYFTIRNTRITGDINTCMYGVHLEGVDHAALENLEITGFWMGIFAKLTDELTVSSSQSTWNSWGIFVLRCGSVSITGSEFSHNVVGTGNHIGVMIQETGYAYVAMNTMLDNWDGVFTYVSSNVQIVDNTIAQAGVGIQSLYTDNLVVSGNSIASTHRGIILFDCPDSVIEFNTVTAEPSASYAYFGVSFMSCTNLRVSSNIVDSFAHGIGTWDDSTPYPMSENVVISGNKIYNCSDSAVRIQRVSNMTVTENSFLLNGVGVHVSPTAYAVWIHHNDFLYNSVQAIEDPYCVGIEWDDGYPSGGNYWSDYTGIDLYSGVNQDVLGSDGIGDSPYATGVMDRYPYMEPIFDW